MPPFKLNANAHTMTLDSRHNEYLRKFKEDEETVIPSYYEQIALLQERLKARPNEESTIGESIRTIEVVVQKLEEERLNYLLSNSKHIYGYFDEKKKISEGVHQNVTVLNSFFKLEKYVAKHQISTHVNAYQRNTDPNFMEGAQYIEQSAVCRGCNQGELVPIEHEGVVLCNNTACSKQYKYFAENEKPSYKEPPQEVCFYAYKRINHFREILAQFQAKESTQIPKDILDNIIAQIKKERIDVQSITNKKVKEILKKFGYNKYYEHIPYIKDKLGIKPPVMLPELEEKLCNLFMEIQRPYAKFCPPDRVNFLNYYYTIYKLCELLEETSFLEYFPMLKDREKRIEQDEIWKKICGELNWEFIPTI
jgi:hypothetical protein